MSCFKPISIKDALTGYPVSVPCGKCIGCLSDKRKMWSYRIQEEIKTCNRSYFLTLTYDEEHCPKNDKGEMIVRRKDVTNFFKRLRKNNPYYNIRYFGCSEYGDARKRPHYHIIIFLRYNEKFYQLPKKIQSALLSYHDTREMFERAWSLYNKSLGFIQLREVRNSDIKYTAKYTIKEIENNYPTKTFNMMSTRPYIGYEYVERMQDWHLKHDAIYYPMGEYKCKLPRIYYEKIFPEDWRRTRTYFNERHALDIDKIVMFFDNKLRGLKGQYWLSWTRCINLDALDKNFFYEPGMLEKEPFEYYKEVKQRQYENSIKEKKMLEKYRRNRIYKSEVNERLATFNELRRCQNANVNK